MINSIGIIGVGAIAEAVVIGFCKSEVPPTNILLSPRNENRARQLAKRFSNIEIATSNQEVASNSELLIIAIRPQIVAEVLPSLTFRKDQWVLSLVAGVSIQQLGDLLNPASKIVRMIPLPAIARHEGPILMSPPTQVIADLFEDMGSLIQVERESDLDTFCAVTGLMAPYFGLLDRCVGWLSANGIDESEAFDFVGALYECLGRTPQDSIEKDFGKVAKEHATPQGFNEQALRELTKLGWYRDVSNVLDLLNQRLEGKASFEDSVD